MIEHKIIIARNKSIYFRLDGSLVFIIVT